jgi:hypothetical protein
MVVVERLTPAHKSTTPCAPAQLLFPRVEGTNKRGQRAIDL